MNIIYILSIINIIFTIKIIKYYIFLNTYSLFIRVLYKNASGCIHLIELSANTLKQQKININILIDIGIVVQT